MKEKKPEKFQAVSIGQKNYAMCGSFCNSSVEMFEVSVYSLYPTDDNYITVGGDFHQDVHNVL